MREGNGKFVIWNYDTPAHTCFACFYKKQDILPLKTNVNAGCSVKGESSWSRTRVSSMLTQRSYNSTTQRCYVTQDIIYLYTGQTYDMSVDVEQPILASDTDSQAKTISDSTSEHNTPIFLSTADYAEVFPMKDTYIFAGEPDNAPSDFIINSSANKVKHMRANSLDSHVSCKRPNARSIFD
ncbi:hypothetical protein RF11_16049 [Thelohanellus kitauei]|uniref:Uncharacterized protein n=1 Tax=Thelohanellus kitauei TaxID=669202 RepID=A0A0C2MQI5_THEKT|nr:hypothetical protein RF11_16049 [Thelohanellus kitauei]